MKPIIKKMLLYDRSQRHREHEDTMNIPAPRGGVCTSRVIAAMYKYFLALATRKVALNPTVNNILFSPLCVLRASVRNSDNDFHGNARRPKKNHLLIAASALLLFNCKAPDKGYDLCLFNTAVSPQLEDAAKSYTSQTGIRIKLSAPAENYNDALQKELDSKEKPVVYGVSGINEAEELRNMGLIQNLSHADHEHFTELVQGIPSSMRLGREANDSFGIPVSIHGSGLVADRRMLASLFASGSGNTLFSDIKTASITEWTLFIQTMERWIRSPFPLRITLSGRLYVFASAKNNDTENLSSAFAIREITDEEDEFDTSPLSPEEELQLFIQGKCLFIEGGTMDYSEIANLDQNKTAHLDLFPLITLSGERSITVNVTQYYAINAIASAAEKKMAYDFLVWLNTDGRQYLSLDPDFVPYNANPPHIPLTNTLGNSVMAFLQP